MARRLGGGREADVTESSAKVHEVTILKGPAVAPSYRVKTTTGDTVDISGNVMIGEDSDGGTVVVVCGGLKGAVKKALHAPIAQAIEKIAPAPLQQQEEASKPAEGRENWLREFVEGIEGQAREDGHSEETIGHMIKELARGFASAAVKIDMERKQNKERETK